jgi:hypothetical protein
LKIRKKNIENYFKKIIENYTKKTGNYENFNLKSSKKIIVKN